MVKLEVVSEESKKKNIGFTSKLSLKASSSKFRRTDLVNEMDKTIYFFILLFSSFFLNPQMHLSISFDHIMFYVKYIANYF